MRKQENKLIFFLLELDWDNTTTGRNGAHIIERDVRGKSVQSPEQIYLTVSA